MAARRATWRAEVMPALDPDRLVFLDETWAKTNMARTTGYAPGASGWWRSTAC